MAAGAAAHSKIRSDLSGPKKRAISGASSFVAVIHASVDPARFGKTQPILDYVGNHDACGTHGATVVETHARR